jgi:tetratricopeptide (TPR) repeat protein
MRMSRVALVVAAMAVGCGSSVQQTGWDETTPTARRTQPATPEAAAQREQLAQQAEAAWAQRSDIAQLQAAIRAWEQIVEQSPNDHETWTRLARGYYFLADCHYSFEEAQHDQMMETYDKGRLAAERALVAMSPDFAERMRNGTRIEEAVSVLQVGAVPALYWRSTNLGKWASAQGFATVLSYKDEIRAIMSRCLELDANYFYAGPHRYFGAFFARAPAFAGGDLERARQHFDQSLQVAPNYFATRVLYAQDYAVKSQNRALFEEQLNLVINGNVEAIPEVAPENRAEQRKARELMARADELFE